MKYAVLSLAIVLVCATTGTDVTLEASPLVRGVCKDVPCGIHNVKIPATPGTLFWKAVGYANGWWNLPVDYGRAMRLFLQISDPASEEAIGELYARGGPRLARNDEAAFAWLSKAAAGGDALAHLQIAMMFDSHKVSASLAAADAPASGAFVAHGYRNDDLGRATIELRIAADAGVGEAAYEFARRAALGIGIDKNCALAKSYYAKALSEGIPQAVDPLHQLPC